MQSLFHKIFEHSEYPQIIFNSTNGILIDMNASARKLFGYEKKDITKLNKIELIFEEDVDLFYSTLQNTINNGNSRIENFKLKLKNGNKFESPIELQLYKNEEQNEEFIVEFIHGKNYTKKSDDIDYSTILNALPDLYFNLTHEGKILNYYTNDERYLYIKPEKFLNKKIQDVLPKNIGRLFDKAISELNEIGHVGQFEYELDVPAGEKVFEARLVLTQESKIIAVIRDVTDKSKTSKELNENRRMLSTLLKHLPGMAYKCKFDKYWTMEFVSDGCKNLTGYKPDDLIMNRIIPYSEIINPADREHVLAEVQNSVVEDRPFQIIYRIITKDNTEKWVWEQGNSVRDENRKIVALEGFITDITAQRIAQEALENSEYKFKSLVEDSFVGVYIIQNDKFIYVNPSFAKIFGYSQEEIIGRKKVLDLVDGDDKSLVNENVRKRFDNEIEVIRYAFKGVKKDHTKIDVEVIGSITVYNNKKAIIGTLLDITERLKSEKLIKENEERFRLLFENMLDATMFVNWNGDILFANKAAAKLFALGSSNELMGLNIFTFIHKNFQDTIKKELREVKEGRGGFLSEAKIITGKNEEKWIESLGTKMTLNDISADLISIRDITGRKQAEERLELLNTALQSAANGILITSNEGKIIWTNRAFTTLTGYYPEEVIGKNTRILKSGKMDKEFYTNLWNTITSGKVWHGEITNRKKDGTIYIEEMTITPVKNPSTNEKYFISVKQDITKRKKVENELKSAKEYAEEMSKLKSIFLANMSHEIRTPLVGILGFAEMLSEELIDKDQKEMSQSILSSGQRLMETLNFILDLSKIEAKKLKVSYKEINIADIVNDTLKTFQSIIKQKGLYLKSVIEDEAITAQVDAQLLRGILNNLTNNAIKFTDHGGVTIEIFKLNLDERDWVGIKIIDTGIGIPKAKQDIIFEEFRQVSEGLDRKYEGTGLGLTITKRFVEELNGRIKLHSEPGKGTTFEILLPKTLEEKEEVIEMVDKPASTEISLPSSQKLHEALLVENDEASIDVTKSFLKEICNIDVVKDGDTALKEATGKKYEIIFMDIDLGWGMNGMEVTQEIKKLPQYKNVPIIALTAYAMKGDKEAFLEAGCTHYLSKPFNKKSIINIVKEVLSIEAK